MGSIAPSNPIKTNNPLNIAKAISMGSGLLRTYIFQRGHTKEGKLFGLPKNVDFCAFLIHTT